MNKDTNPAVTSQFYKLIMKKSPNERVVMGCSMFNTSRQIVKSAILQKYPKIVEKDLKKELFLRFYGMEFSSAQKSKITKAL